MIEAISSFRSLVTGPGRTSEAAGSSSATGAAGVAAPAPVGQSSFSDVLAQVASDAVSNLKEGEASAIYGVQGKASVQRVVEAIMTAEQSLQTAIAVRDKVVSAYQEISRMAI